MSYYIYEVDILCFVMGFFVIINKVLENDEDSSW